MKAFKKWWANLLCSNNENFRVIAELSWERALREVLKQADTIDAGNGLKHRIIMDWIKKELESG